MLEEGIKSITEVVTPSTEIPSCVELRALRDERLEHCLTFRHLGCVRSKSSKVGEENMEKRVNTNILRPQDDV